LTQQKDSEEIKADDIKQRLNEEKKSLNEAQVDDSKVANEIQKEIEIEIRKHDKIQKGNQKEIDELKLRLNHQISIEKNRLIELQTEIDRLQQRRAMEGADKERREEEERLYRQRLAWEEAERQRLLKVKQDEEDRKRRK